MRKKEHLGEEITRILRRSPGLTAAQLKERMGQPKHAVENALSKMRSQGLVQRIEGTRPFQWFLVKEEDEKEI